MEVAYISEACRYMILIVLLSAAWTKTADVDRFATSLADDFYVPIILRRWVAFSIISVEWISFLLILLGGSWSRTGVALALLLFVLFSAIMLEIIIRRRQTFCNCFGRSKHPISSVDLLRNSAYIIGCSFYLVNATYDISFGLLAQLSLVLVAALCFMISISMYEIKHLMR